MASASATICLKEKQYGAFDLHLLATIELTHIDAANSEYIRILEGMGCSNSWGKLTQLQPLQLFAVYL